MGDCRVEFLTVRPCTGNSFVVYPAQMYDLPLKECSRALRKAGYSVDDLDLMINANTVDQGYTLYRTGRLLINPCADEETAVRRAEELFNVLEHDAKIGPLLRAEGVRL